MWEAHYVRRRSRRARLGEALRRSLGEGVDSFGGHGITAHLLVNSPSGLLGDSAIAASDHAAHVCPVGALLPKRRGFAIPIGQRRFDLKPVSQSEEGTP